jgi:exo-beta-1,3-glucanase (GH17 family)
MHACLGGDQQTKTNITVFPMIYLIEKDSVRYQCQKMTLQQALQTYGTDNTLGITVSNEFMPNYIPKHMAPSTNSMDGLAASALLKSKINNIWQMLASMNINLPVGTADTSSYFDNNLLSAVDFGCVFHFFNVKLLMLFFLV